ncbi:MAG: helix-turn-helix domain-containing protein [Schleiferiaceae bacterium]|jgi:transcriptional regulator with XRE-family HTH domain|nr:helix-turn-helix domain-containing protein [Schleiferiaceae bacterium]
MNYLAQNIKYLRKEKSLTQEQLANKIGVKRAMVGAYEEGRAEPRLQTMQNICYYFKIGLDDLVGKDIAVDGHAEEVDAKGETLRILPIVVDKNEDKELGTLVPVKAAAGYLNGFGDVDYIESLPRFSMPFPEMPQDRTYRMFQIKGDSMLPVLPGAYIICEYVADWNDIRNEECYVLVTIEEGVVYKRVVNNLDEGHLLLKSDNTAYDPYTVEAKSVIEVWKAIGYTSFELPGQDASSDVDMNKLLMMMSEMKKDLNKLKN